MNNLYQQLQAQVQQQTPQLAYQAQLNNNQKLSTQQQANLKNNLLTQFLNAPDKEAFIESMVASNPKMQSVLQLFQNSKLTPKQFFYQYAQQNGFNPDQFLNSLE